MKSLLSFILLCSSLFGENYRVIGIGAPCLDLFYNVDEKFLNEIALEKESWKELNWLTFSSILKGKNQEFICTGGSSSNTIKGLASLGIPCALMGCVGEDEEGKKISDAFTSIGVTTLFLKKDFKSAQTACFITPDGDRSFCSFSSPRNILCEDDLFLTQFEGVELVHIDGYRIFNSRIIEKTMELATQTNATVSFDLAHSVIADSFRSRILEILSSYVDIIFANEREAQALVHLPPKEASLFLKNYCSIAVIKTGSGGCWVATEDSCFYAPAIPTKVVDTTGAGDLFASGFLYGYLNGLSPSLCADCGHLLGSAVIENFGAEIPSHRWKELKIAIEQIHCKQSTTAL